MKFSMEFFNAILNDWDYKEIYINDKCIYSCNTDTEFTLSNFRTKVESFNTVCTINWKSINIIPFCNHKYENDGVIIKIELEVSFW